MKNLLVMHSLRTMTTSISLPQCRLQNRNESSRKDDLLLDAPGKSTKQEPTQTPSRLNREKLGAGQVDRLLLEPREHKSMRHRPRKEHCHEDRGRRLRHFLRLLVLSRAIGQAANKVTDKVVGQVVDRATDQASDKSPNHRATLHET